MDQGLDLPTIEAALYCPCRVGALSFKLPHNIVHSTGILNIVFDVADRLGRLEYR